MIPFKLLSRKNRERLKEDMDKVPWQTVGYHIKNVWITELVMFLFTVPLIGMVVGGLYRLYDAPFWYGWITAITVFLIYMVIFGTMDSIITRKVYKDWRRERRESGVVEEEVEGESGQ